MAPGQCNDARPLKSFDALEKKVSFSVANHSQKGLVCLRSGNRAIWRAQSDDDSSGLCDGFRVSDAGCCAYADG